MADAPLDWLVVINAETAKVVGNLLMLEPVQPVAIAFTDRPHRWARRVTVSKLVAGWRGLFGDQPPNAAVTWTGAGGSEETAILELGAPAADGDRVSWPFTVFDPASTAAGRSATTAAFAGPLSQVSLFLDSIPLGSSANTFFKGL